MTNRILVLGGDGYLGWPLVIRLARRIPQAKIVIIDSEFRRKMVRYSGFAPLYPVEALPGRVKALSDIYGIRNVDFILGDINEKDFLPGILKRYRPHTIFHLAHQCSTPFSMLDLEHAIFTVQNNVEGGLKLLYAMREFAPNAHLIQMGSFGEYARGGIEIAEGYFVPDYLGVAADTPMPYPRRADDIYHVSKINSSNFLMMASRHWGLRITEIMQSTIFGMHTDETIGKPALYTRFDYDHVFGTVLNRFITQSISGFPLTVYGNGKQRTGLMSLSSSVSSLASLVGKSPKIGEHKVINHSTESGYTVGGLARFIQQEFVDANVNIEVDYSHDPRAEINHPDDQSTVNTEYLDLMPKRKFCDEVRDFWSHVNQAGRLIKQEYFAPSSSKKFEI